MATPDPASAAAAAHAIAAFGIFIWLFVLGAIILSIVVYWRIASKAGYSGALSLLMLVPVANLIMLLIFAFSEWPIEQELRALRVSGRTGPLPGAGIMGQS